VTTGAVETATGHLGDVAAFVRGITFKPDDVVPLGAPDSVACMRTKNVQVDIDLKDVWAIPQSLVKRNEQYLKCGDLLVSSANSWNLVGKCCWVPTLPWRSTFGGFISALRGDVRRIEPRYLFHWFSSERIQTTVRSFGQQTTNISNLNIERCLNLQIPLPSLSDQQRIADILDRVDALRAMRRAALARLDTFTQAIFVEMFGDPLTNPKAWPTKAIGQLGEIGTGSTPSRLDDRNFGGGIPWIKTTEVNWEEISHTEETLTVQGLRSSRCKLYPKGSVVIALYGQGPTRGRAAILGIEATTNQACGVIQPSDRFDPNFLLFHLRCSYGKLRELSRGGNQANLNLNLLSSFAVLSPPIDLQVAFRNRIEFIRKAGSAQQRSSNQLDALFAALQHRAFRGEL
jgi:type I restriction enzyme S subunit